MPAPSTQNLSGADAALKEDYQPMIREQLNLAFLLLSQIEANAKDVDTSGRRAVLSLHTGRNEGVGARTEDQDLPTAGAEQFTEERVPLRYNYGRIRLTGQVMRASRSGDTSYVRQLDNESKAIVRNLKLDVNRQLWGTSDGVIAQCGVTTASTTVNLTSPTPQQMRQLRPGMRIDIGTVAAPTGRTGALTNGHAYIVSVGASTIVVDQAVTTATTDFIFRQGSGGSGVSQKELTGLQTIVNSTGTLFNVDPTVVPSWSAYELAVGGALTDTVGAKALDEIAIASGEDPGNLVITTHGVVRNYAASLTSFKRFNDTVDLKGGWKGVEFSSASGTAVLTADKDAPQGQAFFLATDHLEQYQASDWEFMDDDGAVLSRVPNRDAYEAVLFKYHEIATDKRNAHGKLTGLTES